MTDDVKTLLLILAVAPIVIVIVYQFVSELFMTPEKRAEYRLKLKWKEDRGKVLSIVWSTETSR